MSRKPISQKNKVKIILWGGVYALVVIIMALLVFEGLGTFVGKILDRPAANRYLSKNYSDIDYKFSGSEFVRTERTALGVTQDYKSYRFYYTITSVPEGKYGSLMVGDKISIDAYNFSVARDSIFTDYVTDNELVSEVNSLFLQKLSEFLLTDSDIKFTAFDAYIDIKPAIGEYESVEAVLSSEILEKADAVVHVVGEKIDFDDYKTEISKIKRFYESGDDTFEMPQNLQVFYYYLDENGEKVMQYQSDFAKYELKYTEEQLVQTEKMHYKVEMNEEETKKVKAYSTVQTVYIIVLSATITVLYTLLTYKKIRKLIKTEEV